MFGRVPNIEGEQKKSIIYENLRIMTMESLIHFYHDIDTLSEKQSQRKRNALICVGEDKFYPKNILSFIVLSDILTPFKRVFTLLF